MDSSIGATVDVLHLRNLDKLDDLVDLPLDKMISVSPWDCPARWGNHQLPTPRCAVRCHTCCREHDPCQKSQMPDWSQLQTVWSLPDSSQQSRRRATTDTWRSFFGEGDLFSHLNKRNVSVEKHVDDPAHTHAADVHAATAQPSPPLRCPCSVATVSEKIN